MSEETSAGEQRFEEQLEQLEEIVARLEDEEVGLEEALDLFERGMKLARACRERLTAIEARVERLLAEDEAAAAGRVTEPLEVEGAE